MAVLIGIIGSLIIWIVTPFNNFSLNNGYITDSYLPIAALALMLIIVLVINPVIGLFSRERMMKKRELGIIFAMLLLATIIPGQGLMRMLPYTLARTVTEANGNSAFAALLAKLNLPAALFPGSTAYGASNPASEKLFLGLPVNEAIPWQAWLAPLASWGVFTMFTWIMMGAMALIVYSQWRKNEKLSFPVVEVQEAFIAEPAPGKLIADIYRSKSFWTGFILVTALYSFNMLAAYFPDNVPALPLIFDITGVFTEPPLSYLPTQFVKVQIFFLFIAAGFFMSFRMGFSIWVFTAIYNFYNAFGRMYVPNFSPASVSDHRYGGMLVLTAYILWTGRAYWAFVLKAMFLRVRTDEGMRNAFAGWAFVIGTAGGILWMCWIGLGLWALYYTFLTFMITLLIMRFIAETGMPFMRIDTGQRSFLMDLFPGSMMTGAAAYFSGIHPLWTSHGSRMNFGALILHAIGINDDAPDRAKARLATGLLLLSIVGIIVGGAAHLVSAYRATPGIAGYESIQWGSETIVNAQSYDLSRLDKNMYGKGITHNRPLHIAVGAVITGALQWLCITFPSWPLHPIGIIIAMTWFGQVSWLSILIGWGIKGLLVRFGGSRLLRQAKPFFIGIIAGEVIAFLLWAVVAAVLAFNGLPYVKVEFQPK